MFNFKKINSPQITSFIRWHVKTKGKNNNFDINKMRKNDVRLKIRGNNNTIVIGDNCNLNNSVINIIGNDNNIRIGDNVSAPGLVIEVGFKWHNATNNINLSIGNKTTINGVSIVLLEDNSQVTIGEDCMFASNIEFWASDTHSITDLEGNLLNYGGNIKIGNHVWIGQDVKICKKAQIADNSVVGFSSVVASKFNQPNVILAGNPAKVIKENTNWSRLTPQNYRLGKE
jgi:acetyltransferase-like isoleucine patch superfamily enzyme